MPGQRLDDAAVCLAVIVCHACYPKADYKGHVEAIWAEGGTCLAPDERPLYATKPPAPDSYPVF